MTSSTRSAWWAQPRSSVKQEAAGKRDLSHTYKHKNIVRKRKDILKLAKASLAYHFVLLTGRCPLGTSMRGNLHGLERYQCLPSWLRPH